MSWQKQLKKVKIYSGSSSRSAHRSLEAKKQELEAADYPASTLRKQQKKWVLNWSIPFLPLHRKKEFQPESIAT